MRFKLIMTILLLFSVANVFAQKQVRIKKSFDFDWKFSLSDDPKYIEQNYTDTNWENVQLPHDWNISMEFDRKAGGSPGFLPESIGWYRKTF